MLKGIPSIISSDLLKALADMGHGDYLVIADDFYPSVSKTPNGVVVAAKGNSATEILDAILTLLPLDADYCAYPVEYMVPDHDANIRIDPPQIWADTIEIAHRHGLAKEQVGTIERTKFYEKAKGAFLTIATSEDQPYGCLIVQKGVK